MGIAAAARDGHRAVLEASRDTLAAAIEDGVIPGYRLADALKSLAELVELLESLDAREKGDDVGKAAATPDEPWSPAGGAQGSPA